MLEGKDIVIVGQQPWDTELGSNCKDIALEFSKHNRVLYINSPLDRITSIRDKNAEWVKRRIAIVRKEREPLLKIKENLWNFTPPIIVESINWISSRFIFDLVNKFNNRRFARSILQAIRQLGFRNFVLFNDNEIFKCFYLNKLLNAELNIYYSRDYILSTPYWKRHGATLEPLIIASNDICLANSEYLRDYCLQYNHRSYYVGQGSNMIQGITGDVQLEYSVGGSKIIGYVGALESIRLDIALIEYIAFNRSDWKIVLVGSEDDVFKASALHRLPNVVFCGFKSPAILPAYVQSFDVCINPQSVNQLTIGNYPRKIDEYLSFGKPVVATRTRAMDVFKNYVYLADNKNSFLMKIEEAITQSANTELITERKKFAESHTWENSVGLMYEQMERFYKGG